MKMGLVRLLGVASLVGCSVGNVPDLTGPDEGPPPSNVEPDPSSETVVQRGPQPSFAQVHQANPPPPISGGTLIAMNDGDHVVAADPDRDRIFIASLASNALAATVTLLPRDEPGRLAEDDAGHVHVALRGGGAIVTIDAKGTSLARRNVCPAPRGVAFDGTNKRMVVACEGGELMAVPTDPAGAPSLIARLDRDLRDVVIVADTIYVSRFRNAEMLTLGPSGVVARWTPLLGELGGQSTLAWRMIAPLPPPAVADPNLPRRSTQPVLVHEVARAGNAINGGSTGSVSPTEGGYGTAPSTPVDCNDSTIVMTAISQPGMALLRAPTQLVLPVDAVVTAQGVAVIAAGNGHTAALPQLFLVSGNIDTGVGGVPCASTQSFFTNGQATAIAKLADGRVIVQSREPAQLEIFGIDVIPQTTRPIPLSADSREDTGHAIFHSNSGSGLACASCHGEGADDGHVWSFDGIGPRRTPSLLGTLQGTAPYHWDGAMTDIGMLADEVMTGRMSGPQLDPAQKVTLESWLFTLPAPASPSGIDTAAAARGRALFENSSVGCATCHSGQRLTSSGSMDVGTGGVFQVPSLIGVGARAPFLHDGCAPTLADRFGACGSDQHGQTSHLRSADIDDLVTYLQTL